MKAILLNMNELSDSTELYESKPNRFISSFIYIVLAFLVIAGLWLYASKTDIVTKASGIVRTKDSVITVSTEVSGEILSLNVSDGEAVEAGQELMTLRHDAILQELNSSEHELTSVRQRIAALEGYRLSLEGDAAALEAQRDNPYHNEYQSRYQKLSVETDEVFAQNKLQKKQQETGIQSMNVSLRALEEQRSALQQARSGIVNQKNTLPTNSTYYSTVDAYLKDVQSIRTKYNGQIRATEENQRLEENRRKAEQEQQAALQQAAAAQTAQIGSDGSAPQELPTAQVAALPLLSSSPSAGSSYSKQELELAMQTELNALQAKQISALDQQLQSVESSILQMNNSRSEATGQLRGMEEQHLTNRIEQTKLAEINTVFAEIGSYQVKQSELEKAVEALKQSREQYIITAKESGVVNFLSHPAVGNTISAGNPVLTIIPDGGGILEMETYIDNADIGKMKEGMKVKYQIAAFPSNEYGPLYGTIQSISKDIKVSREDKQAYYLAVCTVEKPFVSNKNGTKEALKVGMASEVHIITDEKRMSSYLLEKLDLWD